MNRGYIYLFLTAFIWGFCLVGQSNGMEVMGPWSFTAARVTLGGLSLLVFALISDNKRKNEIPASELKKEYKDAFIPGLICAPLILATIIFQQYGLLYTGVGKCAFVTALYIFLVPLFGIFFGEKIKLKSWISVVVALGGLYLITMSSGFDNINKGDIICFGAAIAYSIHMQVVGKVSSRLDTIKFSGIQFTVAGLLSFIPAAIIETGQLTWANYMHSLWPIFLTGIISCAVGYTLQIKGQSLVKPSTTSIILSSESVFSLLAGMIFLHEILTGKEYLGCAVMMFAIAISVIPEKKTQN